VRRPMRWISLAAALLGACSGMARHESQPSLERYLQYAGPPIQRFSYRNSYDGWQVVADHTLAVFVANDAYLLSVVPPCAQLQYALDIRLSSATPGNVSRFDYVEFDKQRCLIDEIRQIDYRKLQQDSGRREVAQKSG
jgi:hypothetical protein